MQNKKSMLIPMLLIVALVTTGFAYAHWEKIITINGSVATGTLDWQFTAASSIDPDGVEDYHCNEGFAGHTFWQGIKNVGYTTAVVTDPHTVTVTMYNVYPCYFVSVSVYAVNTGSIPLIIEKVVIDGHEITSLPAPVVELDLDGDLKKDIEFWWGNAIGAQLEPGDPTPEMSFWIHIMEDAPQGATTLEFTISLVAINWNEY